MHIAKLCRCHLCGESESDLSACETCGQWTCPGCGIEVETACGDPLGVMCDQCDEIWEDK